MTRLTAIDIAGPAWEYLLLFLAVAASWAGLPFIGATALARRERRPARAT